MPVFTQRHLKQGAVSPPFRTFQQPVQPMVVQFVKRPPIPQGVADYVYATHGGQVQSTSGGGVQYNTGAMLGYGQRPLIARPALSLAPDPTMGGRLLTAPLSANPNDPS